jgi:hypothetical protein
VAEVRRITASRRLAVRAGQRSDGLDRDVAAVDASWLVAHAPAHLAPSVSHAAFGMRLLPYRLAGSESRARRGCVLRLHPSKSQSACASAGTSKWTERRSNADCRHQLTRLPTRIRSQACPVRRNQALHAPSIVRCQVHGPEPATGAGVEGHEQRCLGAQQQYPLDHGGCIRLVVERDGPAALTGLGVECTELAG